MSSSSINKKIRKKKTKPCLGPINGYKDTWA